MNEEHRNRIIIRRGPDGLPLAKIAGGRVISNDEALDGIRKVRARLADDVVRRLPDDEP